MRVERRSYGIRGRVDIWCIRTPTSPSLSALSLCSWARGLQASESALLIMEHSHCEPIRRRLQENGFEVSTLEAGGQLNFIEAEDIMPTFLFDGIIDEHKFKMRVGELIRQGKSASSSGQVRVFGEIVNLLWEPDPKSTQRLEELWNDVIKFHSVPLLCAYALGGVHPDALGDSLLACHSDALV